jgi:hypothetical protein
VKQLASRASVRRELALVADCNRHDFSTPFEELALSTGFPREKLHAALLEYMLDPSGQAILGIDEARVEMLLLPLFRWVGPGNAAPVEDVIAALILGPALAADGVLPQTLTERRFAPRADELVAVAIAAMEPGAQEAALTKLWADKGPDPELLALSAVQCGRALAWTPELLELPIAKEIIDTLLARLDPAHAQPHTFAVARALAPIAAQTTPYAVRIRDAALSALTSLEGAPPPTFSQEIMVIAAPRTPGLDRWLQQPRREVAQAAAYILGFASPRERESFSAAQGAVLDHPEGTNLVRSFLDGVLASAHVDAAADLVTGLLAGTDGQSGTALDIAARIPLDSLAQVLLAQLDGESTVQRVYACKAVELLANDGDVDIDAALSMRLGDSSSQVAAAAARTLVERGRRDLVGRHSTREPNPVRRAVSLAALGELDVPTIGELVMGTLEALQETASPMSTTDDSDEGIPPITALINDALLCSVEGLAMATSLIEAAPDAVGVLALACAPDPTRDVGILAPPGERSRLARATLSVSFANQGSEIGALALYLLGRMSCGDGAIADLIAKAFETTDGYAQNLLAALGELRVPTAATGMAVGALLGATNALPERIAAAAVAGRALPSDHAGWKDIRALLTEGTLARAAAWSALNERVRRSSPKLPDAATHDA